MNCGNAYDAYVASDNELVGADNDYVILRARKTSRSQNDEFVVRGYVIIVGGYELIVECEQTGRR